MVSLSPGSQEELGDICYNKNMKNSLGYFFPFLLVGLFLVVTSILFFKDQNFFSYVSNYRSFLAGQFFTPSTSVETLRTKYTQNAVSNSKKNIRILIVPGHEPGYGGTEFKDIKERELVVATAQFLQEYFNKQGKYEVLITRDDTNWNQKLLTYFVTNWDRIEFFRAGAKKTMDGLIATGQVATTVAPFHIDARPDVARRLFGINLFANENNIDIVLHLHLNDYPRKKACAIGEYSGFSVYIPERQYSNAATSRALGQYIMNRLGVLFSTSTLPAEQTGLIEDQELVALGRYNTADTANVLIEYGYIYEPMFADDLVRPFVLEELAYQTYLGVEDFLQGMTATSSKTVSILPYTWGKDLVVGEAASPDIFALQIALTREGLYPPEGYSKEECPLSGKMSLCTKKSVQQFQEKFGISTTTGTVGPETREILNKFFSEKMNSQ
jgi:N-acetylmuramoyl-L-alanine amidase